MGNYVEINDILQITEEQGFPSDLFNVENYQKGYSIDIESIKSREFNFSNKDGHRIYGMGTRIYLVQNINDKWVFWGKVQITAQTVKKVTADNYDSDNWDPKDSKNFETSGSYKIIEIFEPQYQIDFTKNESIKNKSYF
jgi:hypothetical protein